MNLSKKWLSFLLVISFAVMISSCSNQVEEEAQPTKPRVALVMKSLANEFFKTMEDGAKAHQVEHANEYDLIANGIKDETDVSRQIALVEQMIAMEVDALVIAPADSKALAGVCKKAQDAGITVVNIDNKLDESVVKEKGLVAPFVGPDNRKGAQLAGEYLAKQLNSGDEVAIIEGVPNAFNAVQRKLGFEDAMKQVGANIVSSQSANWMPDQAERVVSGIITQNPDVKAILCANDNMALGAVAALRAMGKAGEVKVVGYDNITAVRGLIKDGKILCTIDQHADQIAVYGIQHALQILKSNQEAADKETPVDLVTADSIS